MTFPLQDKLLHFIVGAAISASFGMAGCPALGIAASLVVGAGKEVFDYFHPATHTADVWDFVATALGGVAGFVMRLHF
jgi:hypothetical protein